MRFGFNAHAKPPEAYIDYAVEHDLKHIEIDLIKAHSALPTFDDGRVERLVRLALGAGVTFSLHAPYTIDLASRMPFARRANVAYLEKCIALAARLQGTHITLHIGRVSGFPVWPWKRMQALDVWRRVLRRLQPSCERYGIPLALENASTNPPGAEASSLGDSVDDFAFLFGDRPAPYLKLCLDLGHANTNDGPVAFIRAFGEQIVSVHCHDNLGTADQHLAIGEGTVPWRETGQAFRAIDYRGPYVGECFRQPPHETAACLAKLWAAGTDESP